MLKLKEFIDKTKEVDLIPSEDQVVITGGEYTETGEDTTGCDYFATLDGEHGDCWRLDHNCCDDPS